MKIARPCPSEHGMPFSAWSLANLAGFLVAEGVVEDISHDGLRMLRREEGVSFGRNNHAYDERGWVITSANVA